jgi:hypothetical protein
LHEVGHIVDPDADSSQYLYTLEHVGGRMSQLAAGGELGAWKWAVEHALIWTAAMQDRLEASLRNHPAFTRATRSDAAALSPCITCGRSSCPCQRQTPGGEPCPEDCSTCEDGCPCRAGVDLRAWARAKVSGPGALPAWRQREYQPGERVVHNGRAWVARCALSGEIAWPAPGASPVLWSKS